MTLRSCQSHYSPAEGTSSAWTSRNWTKWWTMKEHYTCPFINLGTRVLQWWLSGRGGQRQMKDSEWLTAATLTSESMKGNLLSLSWTPDTMTSLKAPWFQRQASNQSQAEGRLCLCSHVFIYCAVCKKRAIQSFRYTCHFTFLLVLGWRKPRLVGPRASLCSATNSGFKRCQQ